MEEQSGCYLANPGPGPAAGQEEMMKIADSTHRHQQGGVTTRSQTERERRRERPAIISLSKRQTGSVAP